MNERNTFRSLAERRSIDSGPRATIYDALRQYKDDPDIFVSFRDLTPVPPPVMRPGFIPTKRELIKAQADLMQKRKSSLPLATRIGINPKSTFGTPNGVYTYPLREVWDEYGGQVRLNTPYGSDRPVVAVLRRKHGVSFIPDIQALASTDFDRYRAVLLDYVQQNFAADELAGEDDDSSDDRSLSPESAVNQWSNQARQKSYGGRLWNITRMAAKRNPNKWNWIFRTLLGVEGVVDLGAGIIHPSEPTQAVFFSVKAFDVVTLEPNVLRRKTYLNIEALIQELPEMTGTAARSALDWIGIDPKSGGAAVTAERLNIARRLVLEGNHNPELAAVLWRYATHTEFVSLVELGVLAWSRVLSDAQAGSLASRIIAGALASQSLPSALADAVTVWKASSALFDRLRQAAALDAPSLLLHPGGTVFPRLRYITTARQLYRALGLLEKDLDQDIEDRVLSVIATWLQQGRSTSIPADASDRSVADDLVASMQSGFATLIQRAEAEAITALESSETAKQYRAVALLVRMIGAGFRVPDAPAAISAVSRGLPPVAALQLLLSPLPLVSPMRYYAGVLSDALPPIFAATRRLTSATDLEAVVSLASRARLVGPLFDRLVDVAHDRQQELNQAAA